MKDESNKTEKATPFKLREAKKKGQVAKSMELNHSLILLVFVLIGSALWSSISSQYVSFFKTTLLAGNQVVFSADSIVEWLSYINRDIFMMVGPLVFIILVSGVFSNIIQTGPMISSETLKFDINRLNPVEGLKKLFSIQKLFDLLKNSLKLLLIGCLLYFGFQIVLPQLISANISSREMVASFIVAKIALVGLGVIVILIPIVLLDFIFTKKEFAKKMRMSQREVKEEHKRQDGNPEIKSKRRQAQKELLKKTSAISNVDKADLIIVNPTHYAIGLKYDKDLMNAPVVIVKGRGEMARTIRELAQRYGKIFFRRPSVARALYKNCDIDQPICAEQFSQVAEIYRSFYQLKGEK